MYKEQIERLAKKLGNGFPISNEERDWLAGVVKGAALNAPPAPKMDDGPYWYTETSGYTYLVYVRDNKVYSTLDLNGNPDTERHVSEYHGEWEKVE